MTPDPNKRCTCGFTFFRDSLSQSSEDVQRWVLGIPGEILALGGTPLGYAPSPGDLWSLVSGAKRSSLRTEACASCRRVRNVVSLSQYAVYGARYNAVDSTIEVTASDVGRIGCLYLRYSGPAGSGELTLTLGGSAPGSINVPVALEVAPEPPAGALTADETLVADASGLAAGTYDVTFFDQCSSAGTPLGAVTV